MNNSNIDININDYKEFYNKEILEPEKLKNFNSNNKYIGENSNNNEYILNNNESKVTPNNLLHDLSNINKYKLNFENNKILNQNFIGNINNKNVIEYPLNNCLDINNANIINFSKQEEDFLPKNNESDLITYPLQIQSQSSFIFQQKPFLMEINMLNKNISSHNYDDEGEALNQIFRNNDNFFRSGTNFDFSKYPFNAFSNVNNNNLICKENSNEKIKEANNNRKNNVNLNSNQNYN